MIQNIAPHVYHNHYEEQSSLAGDMAVITDRAESGDRILLVKTQEGWRFPSLGEIFESAGRHLENRKTGETYFFSVDDKRFFRLEADGENTGELLSEEEIGQPDGHERTSLRTEYSGIPGACWLYRRQIREIAPRHVAFAAITALSLDGWYRNNRFCSRCGRLLVRDHAERMLKCPDCGNMVYPRINPAVIVGVTKGESLLMTKYAGSGYRKYALVAGFTEIGETVEETVIREVKEETGLDVTNVRYYKSQPWPFTDTLLMGYYCDAAENEDIHMDDGELSVAEWVKREEINRVQESYDDVSLTSEMIQFFRDHPEKFAGTAD